MTKQKLSIRDYIEIYVSKQFTFKIDKYVLTANVAFKNDYIAIPNDTLTQYVNKKDIVKTFKARKFVISLD